MHKEINERQDLVDALPRKTITQHNVETPPLFTADPDIEFSDDEIIEHCTKAANGAKFRNLFVFGDTTPYGGDDSKADLALCNLIAFFTHDADQIERIFDVSKLGERHKWRARADYRHLTIEQALNRPPLNVATKNNGCVNTKQEIDNQERDDAIYQRALEIHKTGDPVNFILNTCETIHIGDRAPSAGILCGFACQAITNTKGLQPSVYGESGFGKSQLAKVMCWLQCQKYVIHETLTDAALYNMRDELIPGITIFSDDVTLSPELAGTLKRSTSDYQDGTPRRVSQKAKGGYISVKQILPPRIMWLLTSVDQSGGIQVAKRQLTFSVDESTEHQQKVIEFEMRKAMLGISDFPLNEDVKICRELLRQMRENDDGSERLFKVKVPTLNIDWNDVKNTRNLSMFLDLIKSFAVLRFMQRVIDEDGDLVAEEKDTDDAMNLYLEYAADQMHHVTKQERRMLNVVLHNDELTTDDLIDLLQLPQQRVWKLGSSLAEKVPGFKINKVSVSTADIDDETTRRTRTQNVYSINKTLFTLGDYESVVSRKVAKK